jgi:thiamine-phosphate pyrophosphorylase
MLLVISNPVFVENEFVFINELFSEGLEIFHLRKPGSEIKEMEALLQKVNPENHSKIALHQHHELATTFGMKRLHYPGEKRKLLNESDLIELKEKKITLSTSIHALNEHGFLSGCFDYCFFGPVFDSISKPGYHSVLNENSCLPVDRKIKLIALGGISEKNIDQVNQLNFDGAAVLGAIWNEKNEPVQLFKTLQNKCQN